MNHIEHLIERYPALSVCREEISHAADMPADTYRRGGKVLLCGNGGSAADCDHIAGEFLKGFLSPRPITDPALAEHFRANLQGSLPAISLPSITAALTASLNDLNPDYAYAQLLHGLGQAGDLLIAISTSGNAKNVCFAAELAKAKGLFVLALTGEGGGRLAALADCAIRVPAAETYKIQEYHLPVYHAICAAVEQALFG